MPCVTLRVSGTSEALELANDAAAGAPSDLCSSRLCCSARSSTLIVFEEGCEPPGDEIGDDDEFECDDEYEDECGACWDFARAGRL